MENTERDIIVISEGGSIRGIFSAGVFSALQKANIYPRLHSVYAVSCGAHNAAYFLAEDTDKGVIVYLDYLGRKNIFLRNLSFLMMAKQFFRMLLFKKNFDVIDLDYLENIETDVFPLNVQKIKESPVNFYVKVLDPKSLEIKYLDAKEDTLSRIIQSSNMPLYANSLRKEDAYVDGGIMPTDDFIKNVVEKNLDKQIIYILNEKKTKFSVTKSLWYDLLDIAMKTRYFGIKYGRKHLRNIMNYPYAHNLKKYPHVHLIYDDTKNYKLRVDQEKALKSYKYGQDKGNEILRKLNIIK